MPGGVCSPYQNDSLMKPSKQSRVSVNLATFDRTWTTPGVASILSASALALLGSAPSIQAEGFRNPPPGAFNLGRAGGRIAQVDDSSAVTQNPGNLVDLATPEAQLSPTFIYYNATFTSPLVGEAETSRPWKILPNFFAAYPLKDIPVAFGLGVTVPYGLSVEWDRTGAFANPLGLRYQVPYYTELKTMNVNPTVAVKITDWLQAGAGFDAMWSQLIFRQYYPWAIFPGASPLSLDGTAEADGDGFGYGGNLGITVKPFKGHRLAVTYRSPMTVNYDGDFSIDNIPPSARAFGATAESHFSSQITFPTIVAVGYGIELTDTLRIEADFEWIQFSKFQSLDLNLGNNAFLVPNSSIPQDWKNTFTAGIAADWRFHPNWTVRGGYQFYQSPVPDHTMSTTIPDANQNVLTLGLAYTKGHSEIQLAYGYDFYATRNISNNQNPALNGQYQVSLQMISCAYTYRF